MKINHIIIAACFFLFACDEDREIISLEENLDARSLFNSCPNSVDSTVENYHLINSLEPGIKWWVLSRQYASCNGERGIFLFNETSSKIEVKIDLPDEIISPHGLDYSEGFLWLLGYDDQETAYQINPINGEIVNTFPNMVGEGISVHGDSIFIADGSLVKIISRSSSSLINSYILNSNTVQDIAIKGDDIFYIVNGEIDPILRLNMQSLEIDTIALTGIEAPYALAQEEEHFIVVNGDFINRINSEGTLISSVLMPDNDGWITAIRPY